MTDKNYFKLDIDAPVFETLTKEKPAWWRTVCKDHDLYINIRKDNRINVYYKGASVMELGFSQKKFKAKIHSKYLDTDWHATKNYYPMEPEKIVANLGLIKDNIQKLYNSQKENPEGGCEKEIQGELYIEGKYIDTEYEFVYSDPRLTVRIDFTTICPDGMIEFVELKRISDGRLLHQEGSDKKPKVLQQLCDYNRFISEHKSEVENYYKKVQRIMKNVGIQNPLADCKITGVSSNVRLLFACYTDGKSNHSKRRNRVQRITNLLSMHNIISNIAEI